MHLSMAASLCGVSCADAGEATAATKSAARIATIVVLMIRMVSLPRFAFRALACDVPAAAKFVSMKMTARYCTVVQDRLENFRAVRFALMSRGQADMIAARVCAIFSGRWRIGRRCPTAGSERKDFPS